jgi:hypothetical protein
MQLNQVRDRVKGHVLYQVRSQIWDNVPEDENQRNLIDQVDQVDQVWDQVGSCLVCQVSDQILKLREALLAAAPIAKLRKGHEDLVEAELLE